MGSDKSRTWRLKSKLDFFYFLCMCNVKELLCLIYLLFTLASTFSSWLYHAMQFLDPYSLHALKYIRIKEKQPHH